MTTAPAPRVVRVPAPLQALALVTLIESYPRWLLHRFAGEPMLGIRIFTVGDAVSVGSPDALRELFLADPEVVRAGEANALVLSLLGAGSLIHLDGAEHLRMRRLLLPAFHGESVARYRALVEDAAAREVDGWSPGEPVVLLARMKSIALEVIMRGVLGVTDPARAERMRELLPKVLEVNPAVIVAEGSWPALTRGRVAARLPWIRARRELLALLMEEIRDHRERPGEDVLSVLIASRDDDGRGLTDTELRDQLLTLLLAGHETTAVALAWAFELLMRRPDAMARLRAELDAGETAYLDAVIDETLRLRPPLEAAFRRVVEPIEIGGRHLAAGTFVVVSVRAVQRQEWEDPRAFRPERFLDGPPASRYASIPFGGGVRRCIGASFATMEMRAVLTTVLERVELEPVSRWPERQSRMRSITTAPARGARALVSTR